MYIKQTDNDYYIIYDWTQELIYWLEDNTKSYRTLPPDLDFVLIKTHIGFSLFLAFNDPIDEIAFKLRWV